MANGTSTAAQPGGGGAALQRRRLGGTSRKTAAGRSLGAVRLKEARQDEASRVLQDIENIENGVPPPSGNIKPSPLTEVPLATETVANALSPTARFQSELAEHGTTEKWFDEQLTDVKQTGRRSSSGSAASASDSFEPASDRAALTEQLRSIQDAFSRHFRAAVQTPGGVDIEGMDLDAVQARLSAERQRNRGGASIMDLGLDAISRVGQTCVEIAEAVDTTIEQWFEGFQSLEDVQRLLDSSSALPSKEEQAPEPSSAPQNEQWEPPAAAPSDKPVAEGRRNANTRRGSHPNTPAGGTQVGGASAASYSQRRAQEELVEGLSQDVAAREAEFHRMQEECARLQAELRYAANKCCALSEENTLLRATSADEEGGGRGHADDPDPITDFMAAQLAALLAEKAKLAQDNARLLRENTTLQDMLTIGLGSDDEEEEADRGGD